MQNLATPFDVSHGKLKAFFADIRTDVRYRLSFFMGDSVSAGLLLLFYPSRGRCQHERELCESLVSIVTRGGTLRPVNFYKIIANHKRAIA